jgi:hypothetical protein
MSTRPTKFSPAVLSQIASFVQQGLSPTVIAERIGCKVGTLRVRCSQHGISLRRQNGSPAKTKRESRVRLTILLFEATAEALERRGRKSGMSRTRFAATLIEHIVRDDLYAAVIDADSSELHHHAMHHHATRRSP